MNPLIPKSGIADIAQIRGMVHERNVLNRGIVEIELISRQSTIGHGRKCQCGLCLVKKIAKQALKDAKEVKQ